MLKMLNLRLKYSFVYLIAYLLLLLIASLHIYLTVLVNIGLVILLAVYAKSSNHVHLYVFVFAVGNFLIFNAMVTSFAELMPWEIGFHSIFYLISCLYFYWFYKTVVVVDVSFKRNVLHFDNKL